jgi:hypothetical protein
MAPKKAPVRQQENVQLGPQVREGECTIIITIIINFTICADTNTS